MSGTTEYQSLERYINRKRLFVRVQANVNRELFIQKLNAAFPGARIGVGNAERGPVTQRIADVTYDTAAEAGQALRRNRFKLKVGSHDADITYQIERKDVVEKLAGEWGCRFMVVVKNLPPGEVSCAELSEMFEAVGEIFTIKVLPGNRGEPYALVQYVEEQSVDLSIQQINQQKLHGAVLYVERHLKARRQASGGQSAAAPAAPSAPPAVPPPPPGAPTPTSSNTSRAPTAAAALTAGLATSNGNHTGSVGAAHGKSGGAAGVGALQPKPASTPNGHTPTAAQVVQQSAQQPAAQLISTGSAGNSSAAATSTSNASSTLADGGLSSHDKAAGHSNPPVNAAPGPPPPPPPPPPPSATPTSPTTGSPTKTPLSNTPSMDQSSSLFSSSYGLSLGKSDTAAMYGSALGGGSQHSAGNSAPLSLFGTPDLIGLGGPKAMTSGGGLSSSPTSLIGPSLGGIGPLGSSMPSLSLGLGTSTASHQVVTPMLDLFSHLREPIQGSTPPNGASELGNGSLTGGSFMGNGTGSTSVFQSADSKSGSYAGLLARQPSNQPTNGALLSPTSQQNSNSQLHSAPSGGLGSSLGHPMTAASSFGASTSGFGVNVNGVPHALGAGLPHQLTDTPHGTIGSSLGGRPVPPPLQVPPSTALSLGVSALGSGLGQPQAHSALTSPTHQQHVAAKQATAGMVSGGLSHGVQRISIRDTLRLALGRLEEVVTCPLTGEIMRDPVIAADGFSYERSAIQAWLINHGAVSPVNSEAMQHKMLIPNRLAKEIIADILPS